MEERGREVEDTRAGFVPPSAPHAAPPQPLLQLGRGHLRRHRAPFCMLPRYLACTSCTGDVERSDERVVC